MKQIVLIALLLLAASTVQARVIEDVEIAEQITVDGTQLVLNGAGIRSKFFFDIYISELYLQNASKNVEEILAADTHKRMVMHFLYSEVAKDSMIEVWNEGFENNLSEQELAALQPQIDAFNAMFVTVKEGEQVLLDYIPGKGTEVTIKEELKGVVEGKKFNDALLSIWLGEEPASEDLKEELLGL